MGIWERCRHSRLVLIRPAQPGDPVDLSTYITNQFVSWRDWFGSWGEFFNGGGKKSDSGVLALAVFGIPGRLHEQNVKDVKMWDSHPNKILNMPEVLLPTLLPQA